MRNIFKSDLYPIVAVVAIAFFLYKMSTDFAVIFSFLATIGLIFNVTTTNNYNRLEFVNVLFFCFIPIFFTSNCQASIIVGAMTLIPFSISVYRQYVFKKRGDILMNEFEHSVKKTSTLVQKLKEESQNELYSKTLQSKA